MTEWTVGLLGCLMIVVARPLAHLGRSSAELLDPGDGDGDGTGGTASFIVVVSVMGAVLVLCSVIVALG